MTLSKLFLAGMLTAAASFGASVGPTYYLVTGQSNANTTIDLDHLMEWTEPSSGQPCIVTGGPIPCASFATTYFNPTFDWNLGGGDFTIKTNGATADITLSLFDVTGGNVGGVPGALTGSLVTSATVVANTVSNAYTSTAFHFAPVTLLTGRHYLAILTSATLTNGSNQYDIKGIDTLTIETVNQTPITDPGAVPEPATWLLMSGFFGVAAFAKRKSLKL